MSKNKKLKKARIEEAKIVIELLNEIRYDLSRCKGYISAVAKGRQDGHHILLEDIQSDIDCLYALKERLLRGIRD